MAQYIIYEALFFFLILSTFHNNNTYTNSYIVQYLVLDSFNCLCYTENTPLLFDSYFIKVRLLLQTYYNTSKNP